MSVSDAGNKIPVGGKIDQNRDAAIVEGYVNGGLAMQEIGDEYGITRERVRQILERNGVGGRKPEEVDEKEAIRLFYTGLNFRQIAERLDCGKDKVSLIVTPEHRQKRDEMVKRQKEEQAILSKIQREESKARERLHRTRHIVEMLNELFGRGALWSGANLGDKARWANVSKQTIMGWYAYVAFGGKPPPPGESRLAHGWSIHAARYKVLKLKYDMR